NGLSQVGVARLNTSGSLDTAFATGGFRPSRRVAVLNDNSVVVGGQNICGNQLFAWYTAEGVLKPALDPNPDSFESITALLPLPDGGFLIGGWYSYLCFNNSPVEHEGQVWRYAADGSYRTLASFGNEADVLALALRSDGKVMLGGQGRPKTAADVAVFDGLALLDLSNAGLEKVSAFNPVVGDEADIYSLNRYADGRLLVAGNFSHVNGSPRFGLARLLANGNLDPSFQPFADQPGGWSMAALALPDGRAVAGFGDSGLFLIGGNGALTDLSAFNDYDRVSALAYQAGKVLVGSDFGLGVRRLKADFTGQDETFVAGNAYGAVRALAVQADNKILVAGNFTQYNSAAAPGLVRLNSNGGLDGGFVPPIFMLSEYVTAEIYALAPLPAGEVLVGGNFTTVDGADHPALVRLDSSGALDNAFSPPSSFHIVYAICVQDDESIWAGGMDASFFRHPLVLHLAEDGQVDTAFTDAFLSAHDEGFVSAILCNSDGLSWAGGSFSFIDGRPFYSLARYFLLRAELFIPFINR
ncbi:MAG: delta-60 repeat domain-containing protein, partial [Anaerolineales bacterium]